MRIRLQEHFSYGKLLRFTLPSIAMMVFTSVYGVVDGLFVSNYVGKTPFAAVNLIFPLIMILGAFGFMIGTGGTAIVARVLGEGESKKGNEYFSLLIYFTLGCGAAVSALGLLALRPVAGLLGAEGEMLDCCIRYGRIILAANPFFMLQNVYQSFFVAAEKPKLGLWITVAAGVTNMVLDWLFIAVLGWGLEGAALATSASQIVGGLIPTLYFARENDSLLRLGAARWHGGVVVRTCVNGSSELMSSVSSSLVTVLYNFQLMRFAGEDGVAAYGVVMYVAFFFAAVFIGYAVGCAPVISWHFGARNTHELKSLLGKSLRLVGGAGCAMAALAWLLATPLSTLFVGYDPTLCVMTVRGFRIFAFSFLMSGLNIFGSSFFTALNDGAVSAAISFLRTLVFQAAFILALPALWQLDGVWISSVAAEVAAIAVTALFLAAKRSKYQY